MRKIRNLITNWLRKIPNKIEPPSEVVAEPAPEVVQEATPEVATETASESSATTSAPFEGAPAAAPTVKVYLPAPDLSNLLQPGSKAIVLNTEPAKPTITEEQINELRTDLRPRNSEEIARLLLTETFEETQKRSLNDRMRIEHARIRR